MKRIFEYGLLVIFITIILVMAYKIMVSYKGLQNDIKSLSYDIEEIKANNTIVNKIYLNSINAIPKNILNKIAGRKEEKLIVGFFNNDNCKVCIGETIIELEVFASKFGSSNINLISNVENEEDFFESLPLEGKNPYHFPYYFVENNNTLTELYGSSPVILVINPNGEILHIYIIELQKEYNEIYFNQILPEILSDQI